MAKTKSRVRRFKVGDREVIIKLRAGRQSEIRWYGKYGKELSKIKISARSKDLTKRQRSLRYYRNKVLRDEKLLSSASTITERLQEKNPDKIFSRRVGEYRMADYLYRKARWEKSGKRGPEPRGPSPT